MRCTSPRTVGFKADGNTIAWSQKNFSKEYASFQLPCGKCIECRLDYARQWAIRCVHEAQMHEKNSFITLTYDDEHLVSPKLIYSDFQKFMKRLRRSYEITCADGSRSSIGCFVTGEYGDVSKRPHWHALIFGWRPTDLVYKYSNERGDRLFDSYVLGKLWPYGFSEIGDLTFESAGYCARYAAKKLVHGNDGHDFEPISKKSSKHAIGKTFLEKYWADIFNYGQLRLPNGKTCSIPRYYEKWLKKEKPTEWLRYVTEIKVPQIERVTARVELERSKLSELLDARGIAPSPRTKAQARKVITEQKFKQLQENLKL